LTFYIDNGNLFFRVLKERYSILAKEIHFKHIIIN